MITTIGSFAVLVDRDYGTAVKDRFLQEFPDPSLEINFSSAMDIFNGMLSRGERVPRPIFGPTSPCCLRTGFLIVED